MQVNYARFPFTANLKYRNLKKNNIFDTTEQFQFSVDYPPLPGGWLARSFLHIPYLGVPKLVGMNERPTDRPTDLIDFGDITQ